jgi:hypothetical protein
MAHRDRAKEPFDSGVPALQAFSILFAICNPALTRVATIVPPLRGGSVSHWHGMSFDSVSGEKRREARSPEFRHSSIVDMGQRSNKGTEFSPYRLAVWMGRAFSLSQEPRRFHTWGAAPVWYGSGLRPSGNVANSWPPFQRANQSAHGRNRQSPSWSDNESAAGADIARFGEARPLLRRPGCARSGYDRFAFHGENCRFTMAPGVRSDRPDLPGTLFRGMSPHQDAWKHPSLSPLTVVKGDRVNTRSDGKSGLGGR